MCDFIAPMKIDLVYVYNLYSNPSTFFKCHVFHNFTSLAQRHENIVMKWIINLTTMNDHMVFECSRQHILVRHQNLTTNAYVWITRQDFSNVVFLVKQQCCTTIVALMDELEARFPTQVSILRLWMPWK
jgi:hypothetical protein